MKRTNPNHIPYEERIANVILSLAMFAYGTFGLISDDIYIPGKRSHGVHIHGIPAWVMYFAFLCAIANMISVVIDHYDRRPNVHNYKNFARVSQITGWSLFGLSIVLDLFVFHESSR